ncbi:TetR/AcrR family transcriptional regulator [Streptomyces sp. NPDC028635]|uniref:TetR/AcrR family transcriptional regulator n=1 Tax=Streptomyces sp. NPDC028635 TaxID=3154800 RepID=UPI0034016D04
MAATGRGGGYGRLSRRRMLLGALRLVDREGLAALSMRRLGAELGVEAMALYRHAASKDELLDGLIEELHREHEERRAAEEQPDAADGTEPWRAGLHRIARTTYEICRDHPRAAPLLTTRVLEAPLARRPPAVLKEHLAVLARLREAGLDERRVPVVFRACLTWIHGYPAVDLCLMEPPEELPELRAATAAEPGGTTGLATGLDALLDRLVGPAGAQTEG